MNKKALARRATALMLALALLLGSGAALALDDETVEEQSSFWDRVHQALSKVFYMPQEEDGPADTTGPSGADQDESIVSSFVRRPVERNDRRYAGDMTTLDEEQGIFSRLRDSFGNLSTDLMRAITGT